MIIEAPEQRVLLRNVAWETYERLREERQERPVPRFFYDRGVLELLSPSTEHESISDTIASLIKELAVLMEIDVFNAGSTTYVRRDLSGGFEPDESFYFADRAPMVRGKRMIDLDTGDPPPDLVVEVDLTSPSLAKLPVYARLGVREVWRYAEGQLEILGLEESGEGYELLRQSTVLGAGKTTFMADELGRLVGESSQMEYPEWIHQVRRLART